MSSSRSGSGGRCWSGSSRSRPCAARCPRGHQSVAHMAVPGRSQDDHRRRPRPRTSSGRSKFAVTRWTSSWSSSVSIMRRFWRTCRRRSPTVVLAPHGQLRRLDLDAGGLHGLAHGLQVPRRGVDLDAGRRRCPRRVAPASMAIRATSSGSARRGDADEAARLELPGDGARSGQRAAGLGEDRAHVRGGAVAVVRGGLHEDGHAAGAVALVDDLLELLRLAAAASPSRWRA